MSVNLVKWTFIVQNFQKIQSILTKLIYFIRQMNLRAQLEQDIILLICS